jgi:hypothetical protein
VPVAGQNKQLFKDLCKHQEEIQDLNLSASVAEIHCQTMAAETL